MFSESDAMVCRRKKGTKTMMEAQARDAVVSKQQVVEEIESHQLNPDEFFATFGDHETYKGWDVLDWLGY